MKYIYIIVFLILGSNLTSQINTPKYSNEFLNIGVGARSLAMSNSVITSTNSAMSAYLNPANLIKNENDIQIGLMHAEYFAGNDIGFHLFVAQILHTCNIVLFMFSKII